MNQNKTKKVLLRKVIRRRPKSAKSRNPDLLFAILRSFFAGAGTGMGVLCLMAVVFSKTNFPLNWIGPAACGAAAVGAFVSGMVLSHSVNRFKLLMGMACGAFYCLCSMGASLLNSRMPSVDETNISLLAVLMLGAVAGSAAGALRTNVQQIGMH